MKTWNLRTSTTFDKQFEKLNHSQQTRILNYLEKRVLPSQNPKSLAKSLTGEFSGYWRFRVGDYRIIADIQDDACTIIAIDVGHRREVYN